MSLEVRFRKTGRQIKDAVSNRVRALQGRRERRNAARDAFMRDAGRLRSYLVRSAAQQAWGGHAGGKAALFSKDDISSEALQEVAQLCRRLFEIEQELHRLELIRTHLADEQTFELPCEDLVLYGFDANIETDRAD